MKKDMSTPPEPKPDKDTDTGISGPVSWPPKVGDVCCCLSPLPRSPTVTCYCLEFKEKFFLLFFHLYSIGFK